MELPDKVAEPVKPPPAVVQRPAAPHEEITLGGEGFNLTTVVTTRGAGVQSVVLNHFQAADEMGRPLQELLHLVPADRDRPSNLLDLFKAPDDEDAQDTLGQLEWQVESRPAGQVASNFPVATSQSRTSPLNSIRRFSPLWRSIRLSWAVTSVRLSGVKAIP